MRLIPACLALSVALCGAVAPVWAGSSSIWWPGWGIDSTENLADAYDEKKPLPHPLSALFDAKTSTTWVMNPRATLEEMRTGEAESFFPKTKRGLMISGKPRYLSGLQIQNGDNSSRRAFQNGNRIRSLKITLLDGNKRRAYTLPLQDRMGWQRVSFPRGQADKIAIEFAEMIKIGKPVCASGLGFLDGASEIKWNMPQAVMFADGFEGCGSALLLNRRGRVLDGVASDAGYQSEWSSDGRFVAGLNGGGNYVWVADAKRGKIIRKIAAARGQEDEAQYQWIAPRQLRVQWTKPDSKNNWKPFQTKIYRF